MPTEKGDPRLEELNSLRDLVERTVVSDDEAFSKVINAVATTFEITDRAIADALLVSRPTVSRWRAGKNLPRRPLRKSVLDWVAVEATRRYRNRKPVGRTSSSGISRPDSIVALAAKSR